MDMELHSQLFDKEIGDFYEMLPETIRLAMQDFEHWAFNGNFAPSMRKLVYMFNMSPRLLRSATELSLQSYVRKSKAKFDSEHTRKKFNGHMIKFKLLNTEIMVWTKIMMTKKHLEFSSVSIAEARQPGKYRNEKGNLYIVRLDGLRFRPGRGYPGDYTILTMTGHALDRFIQRVGIEERLTRDESIKVFVNYMLLHPVKMVLESLDLEEPRERVKKATLFIDTHDGIIYLPGSVCLLSDHTTELRSNFMVCKTAINNDNFQPKSLHQMRDFKLHPEVWNEEPTAQNYFATVFNSEINEAIKSPIPYRRLHK